MNKCNNYLCICVQNVVSLTGGVSVSMLTLDLFFDTSVVICVGIDVMSILMDILILFWSEQLKELQKEYGKLQTDYYRFQKNQTNLEKKFSYDL